MKNFIYLFLTLITLSSCSPTARNLEKDLVCKAASKSHFPCNENAPQLICRKLTLEESFGKGSFQEEDAVELRKVLMGGVVLDTKNITPGRQYTLYITNTRGDYGSMGEFVADENGKLVNVTTGQFLSKLSFALGSFHRGEGCYYVLISEDKQESLSGHVVPHPYEHTFSDGAEFTITLISPDFSSFILVGKGFNPGENLKSISQSSGETLVTNFTVSNKGFFVSMLMPAVIGKNGGPATLTLQRDNGEKGSIHYKWGMDALLEKPTN